MSDHADHCFLPPEVIEAFTSSAMTALRELTQSESFAGEPVSVAGPFPAGALSAVVRLQRKTPGKMALVMSVETAERLAQLYLPAGTELADDIVADVAGEFANVIVGQAKTVLKGTPYHFTLSIPSVSRGGPANLAGMTHVASLEFESGRLHLFVGLSSCPGA